MNALVVWVLPADIGLPEIHAAWSIISLYRLALLGTQVACVVQASEVIESSKNALHGSYLTSASVTVQYSSYSACLYTFATFAMKKVLSSVSSMI